MDTAPLVPDAVKFPAAPSPLPNRNVPVPESTRPIWITPLFWIAITHTTSGPAAGVIGESTVNVVALLVPDTFRF